MDSLPDSIRRVHVLGVGGVGMSALAQALLDRAVHVFGADRFFDQGVTVPIFQTLQRAGVKLVPEDAPPFSDATDVLVLSTAIEESHPTLQQARSRGIPVWHRTELIQYLAKDCPLIGIAGTAGKSTITAMTGWLLEQLGYDPDVINGAELVNWQAPDRVGSTRLGANRQWVLELDESDKSLLRFEPDWSVISNISVDHYALDELQQVFSTFADQTRQGVLCGPGVCEQLQVSRSDKLIEVEACEIAEGGFRYHDIQFEVPMPGRHNVENARLAVAVCQRLGCPLGDLAEALRAFKGVHRRLQKVGVAKGITVVDDYAHNPMKISAAWQAMADQHARVFGVWRPHGFKPLSVMMDELVDVLPKVIRPQDRFFVLPVFYAGGTTEAEVSSDDLVERLARAGVSVAVVNDYEALAQFVSPELNEGDALLVLGARDPGLSDFSRNMVGLLNV